MEIFTPEEFSDEEQSAAFGLIRRQWELPAHALGAQEQRENALREALVARVGRMLNDHFGTLVHALRRLDVREKDFHAAMQLPNNKEIAEALAALILAREFEKARTRKKYRSGE